MTGGSDGNVGNMGPENNSRKPLKTSFLIIAGNDQKIRAKFATQDIAIKLKTSKVQIESFMLSFA